MTKQFPYKIIDRSELIHQMNNLGANGEPFLFIIDFNAANGYLIRKNELDDYFLRFTINDFIHNDLFSKEVRWLPTPISIQDYRSKFEFVQRQIQIGNSFLVNLTQPSNIDTNLSLEELFQIGFAKYKLWLKDNFTVLSPECFIRIEGNIISSFPMKGTINASIPNAEEVILTDTKEKAEHATIVDLIRNDLSLVASEVEVKRYRYIEKIKTNKQDLLQVSSEISGLLSDNYRERLGDILFSLLPAGSICGAPKHKTLEIIEQAEGYNRGFYTGIFGWFDGVNLDSAVMIRFIEQDGDQLIFKSGGGITSKSELINEYEELIQKVYVPIH